MPAGIGLFVHKEKTMGDLSVLQQGRDGKLSVMFQSSPD
ncbi:hypothetical protein D1BOALGB6SA_1757 [Olavius sp. associated proteobacterium Delta 1]|nr:hypothetical protein D1BOALGB6SA_1757 [Olavius sp. associated proteobacterium Delta 1]